MAYRILFILLLLPLIAQAESIPDYAANYLVKINGIQAGELRQSLSTVNDDLRRFESVSQAKGVFSFFKPDVVTETSLWSRFNNKIRPKRYVYERSGGKKEKFLSMDFDWPEGQVHIDDHKQPWTLSIPAETQDKLAYQLTLMEDLRSQQTRFEYQIADGGRLKHYEIVVLAEEVVNTPLGKINTVKLKRHRDRQGDRETTLWCAPALSFLPVKLEHIEKDGTVFTALIRQLKGFAQQDTAFSPQHAPATNNPFRVP